MVPRPFQPAAVLSVALLSGLLRLVAALSPTATTAADSAYLASWAAIALLPAALIPPAVAPRGWILGVGGLAAIGLLPGLGGARAALFGAALVATVSALWLGSRWRERLVSPAGAVAAAIALQALFRSERIVDPPSPAAVVTLVALPALAGLAVAWLARSRGPVPALVAGGAAVALGGGFGVLTTCCLVATAAALAEETPWTLRLAVLSGASVAAVVREPVPGVLVVVAATALLLRRRGWWPAVLTWSAAGVSWAIRTQPPPEAEVAALLVLAAAPALIGLLALRPDRMAAATGLAVAGWAATQGPGAAAAGTALVPASVAGLCLLPRRQPLERAALGWAAAVVTGCAGLAAYPWLRSAPLATPSTAEPTWSIVGATAAAFGLLVAWCSHPRRAVTPAVAVLATIALALRFGPPARPAGHSAFTLAAGGAPQPISLPPQTRARGLIVDTAVGGAPVLEPGTPVATLVAELPGGAVRRRQLRVGLDTESWDPGPGHARPWRFSVAGDGRGLTAVYRTRWRLSEPTVLETLTVEPGPELPNGAVVVVERVVVEP